jgi:ABC-2 type transport system ATP-binding protein
VLLTGRENLVLFGRLLRLGRAKARRRADELLDRFDLTDAAGKPVKAYSGGMRRRLDLAISMVVPRPVLFLDEPTTGLDPRSRGATWEVVRELRAAGTTVLLTTQYLEEADRLADRLAVIDHGRVIAEGTARELKDRAGGAVCEIRLRSAEELGRVVDALGGRAHEVATACTVTVPAPDTRTLVEIARILDDAGIEPEDLVRRRPTLDDVFLTLTGHREAVGV